MSWAGSVAWLAASAAPPKITRPTLERALASEPVAERARGQQQPGEHERVRVDDPLQLGARRAELALDRRATRR